MAHRKRAGKKWWTTTKITKKFNWNVWKNGKQLLLQVWANVYSKLAIWQGFRDSIATLHLTLSTRMLRIHLSPLLYWIIFIENRTWNMEVWCSTASNICSFTVFRRKFSNTLTYTFFSLSFVVRSFNYISKHAKLKPKCFFTFIPEQKVEGV